MNTIKQVLNNIPLDMMNKVMPVVFCFYGEKSKLNTLHNNLKLPNNPIHDDYIGNELLVKLSLSLDEHTLTQYHQTYSNMANQYAIDYDGFYIEMDNHSNDDKEITPLSSVYQTGSAFKFYLKSGGFGYLIYIADLWCDVIDGIFYDDLTLDTIYQQKRLYPQPIMLRIDVNHTAIAYIGTIDFEKLPKQMLYKASIGYPSPEEIAQKAKQYHFDNPYDEHWWDFLQCLKDNHDILYQSDEPAMLIRLALKANNQIISEHIYDTDGQIINGNDELLEFGTIIILEDIEEVLLGKMDKIRLVNEMIR